MSDEQHSESNARYHCLPIFRALARLLHDLCKGEMGKLQWASAYWHTDFTPRHATVTNIKSRYTEQIPLSMAGEDIFELQSTKLANPYNRYHQFDVPHEHA